MTKPKSPILDGQRQCTKCGTIKPVSDFYEKVHQWSRHNASYTGASNYMSECKNCFKERMRATLAARAAQELDRELRPYPWHIAVGVGNVHENQYALFLYVKSGRHLKLNELSQGWRGFEVIVEVTGAMHRVSAR